MPIQLPALLTQPLTNHHVNNRGVFSNPTYESLGNMTPAAVETLFRGIVADFNAVHDAYKRAGLLTDSGPGSLAWSLLGSGEEADRFRRQVLLVDALVRHRVARLVFDRHGPRHIVVFGGNNVGKSTVVNILAAASLASTSPEGGHTRHAQAFSAAPPPLFPWNPYAFSRFSQVTVDQLRAEDPACYTVRPIAASVLPHDVVLWDSPDCDAVGSTLYLAAVVEAAAAADLIIYVTSVEKYAVADLVEWLFLLNDAGIPILECLNKTPKRDRPQVVSKQTDEVFPTMSKRLNLPAPDLRVVALRYMADGEEADLWGPDHPEATELRDAALATLAALDQIKSAETALLSVRQRVDRVLEPAYQELSVRSAWKEALTTAVAAFVTTYESEYLAGSAVIDPFKQLNAALLALLDPDIPRLGGIIRGLRKVQRLPTEVLKIGWRWVSEKGETTDSNLAPELRAYANAHRALLGGLRGRIDAERKNPRHHPFWDQLAEEWDRQAALLADEFGRAVAAHMEKTDTEIKTAARDILKALQRRPTVLKLLRAARVSTDISGLVIGFVIPGHGHIGHDVLDQIVIAPLMLGATGAAADYAVEGYVARRRTQILDKLRAEARDMAAELYFGPLGTLGDAVMTQVGALGIEQALLDRIPANLRQLQDAVVRRPTGAYA